MEEREREKSRCVFANLCETALAGQWSGSGAAGHFTQARFTVGKLLVRMTAFSVVVRAVARQCVELQWAHKHTHIETRTSVRVRFKISRSVKRMSKCTPFFTEFDWNEWPQPLLAGPVAHGHFCTTVYDDDNDSATTKTAAMLSSLDWFAAAAVAGQHHHHHHRAHCRSRQGSISSAGQQLKNRWTWVRRSRSRPRFAEVAPAAAALAIYLGWFKLSKGRGAHFHRTCWLLQQRLQSQSGLSWSEQAGMNFLPLERFSTIEALPHL